MKTVDLNEIRKFYNDVPSVWSDDDIWHKYSRERIQRCLNKCNFLIGTDILNAGSGGSDYNLTYKSMLHVDIAEDKIKRFKDYLVSSIENIPIASETYENAICVGSVLNYCDPISAISELWRILKPGGHLIIEYESSWGFEYLGENVYKKDAIVANIEYLSVKQNQWLFSPLYIKGILVSHKFKMVKTYKFHIIDGIVSKMFNDRISVLASKALDKIADKTPLVHNHANNVILVCKKL